MTEIGDGMRAIHTRANGDAAQVVAGCREFLGRVLNLETMARAVTEGAWERMSGAQREAYQGAFADRLAAECARALADYSTQIKLKPDVLAFINRGNVYRDTEQFDRAAADYGEAARIAPTDARGWRNRGMIRLYQGDNKGGLADYDKALQYDPADAYSWNNRGQARMRLGDVKGWRRTAKRVSAGAV